MQKKQLNNIIQKITELSKEDKAAFLDYMLSTLTNDSLKDINEQIININNKANTAISTVNKINAFNLCTLNKGYGNYEKILSFTKNKINIFYDILKYNTGITIMTGTYEAHIFININSNFLNKTITLAETYANPIYFPNSLKLSDIDTSKEGTYYLHIISCGDNGSYLPWYLNIQKIK